MNEVLLCIAGHLVPTVQKHTHGNAGLPASNWPAVSLLDLRGDR